MPNACRPPERIFAWSLALVVAIGLNLPGGIAVDAQTAPTPNAASIAAFDRIATVLLHPRCLNCHQKEEPLQTDAGKIHEPRVLRGADNLGVGALRCASCHRDENNETTGVPGAPRWQLAPPSMAWAGLSVAELCRSLKDTTLNGNRSLDALVRHVGDRAPPLVLWAWNPGGKRAPVPIDHAAFVDLVRVWVAGDGACPVGRQ